MTVPACLKYVAAPSTPNRVNAKRVNPSACQVPLSNKEAIVVMQSWQIPVWSSRQCLEGLPNAEDAATDLDEVCWGLVWSANAPASSGCEAQLPPLPLGELVFLRSVFRGRPPTLLFRPYNEDPVKVQQALPTAYAGRVLADGHLREKGGGAAYNAPKMYYGHTRETHEYNAVLDTLEASGIKRATVASRKWALVWSGVPKPQMLREFHPFQKTNHFPCSFHLGRKDSLWRRIRPFLQKYPNEFNITPQTFVIPEDLRAWDIARSQQPGSLWITKPVNSSCGNGIKLLRPPLDAETTKVLTKGPAVIQRYVERPLLLHGYKFDLRLYVVVTSFEPLKVYLCQEGLVRLATEKYSLSTKMLHHRTMHLTNYSVNKLSEAYVKNLDGQEGLEADASPSPGSHRRNEERSPSDRCEAGEGEGESEGTRSPVDSADVAFKWSLQQLREYFDAEGLDYTLMMTRVKDLVVKTLITVEPVIVSGWHCGASFSGGAGAQAMRGIGPNQTCFEIYGFDVIIDENLQPLLLEVNILPSFSSSSPLDKRIKAQLIADVLTLVGVRPFDHRLISQAAKEERLKQACSLQPKLQNCPQSHSLQTLANATLMEFGAAEWTTIMDAHDEASRSGCLERIFPTRETGEKYGEYFTTPRYSNGILAKWLEAGGSEVFLPPRQLVPEWVPEVSFPHLRKARV
eukprot:TRINITY_DN59470_c0_g2_i2.p1 TRINITY_DN59470_c0_g2~~TRINITY_DN59470_c0_g2_i2.p1  ORF type:complete len:685 (+),score=102.90 TRINITY_DN59470_c0_g2_i2:2250-4304(+)